MSSTGSDHYDVALFRALAAAESHSFWFRARNRLILSTLRGRFPGAGSLLEIGCGTGFVLEAIRAAFPHLRLVGSELYEEGLEVARERLPGVELLQLDARDLPFADEFGVVGAFDVLEHIEEDVRALEEIHRAIVPGGGALLLVPQHSRLWSAADTVARHVRRYTRRELARKVRGAGFEVEFATSFVATLLPAMAVSRTLSRVSNRPYNLVGELQPGPLNRPFERILDAERWLIERGVSFPAGGSLLLVARKLG